MYPRNTKAVFFSFLFFTILSSSSSASTKRYRQHRRRRPCLQLEYALEKAYYAQVDLVRRGLPTPVVQAEFAWAVSALLDIKQSFKFQKLKEICIEKRSWDHLFDKAFRAKFVLQYLKDIRSITKEITFLDFKSHPTLPPLSQSKQNLVRTMWLTCLVQLRERPRSPYKVSDFPFPKNIEVLHDPKRAQACQQYNKFNIASDRNYHSDAKSVLVALTVVSVNLYHRGGNKKSITQMLKHFVGFVFNGVRCLRLEGADVKIPRKLITTYSRNVAMITSTTTKPELSSRILLTAAERVFGEVFHSLLSYNSWGHLIYAVPSPHTLIPFKVDVITKILGRDQYKLLLFYSKSPKLLTPQRSLLREDRLKHYKISETVQIDKAITCDEGYVLMRRREEVTDPLERCCNKICQIWSDLMSGIVTNSAEGCCSRCNQANQCDPGITAKDMKDNNYYSFFIPEYGEQDQLDMYLVAL